MEKKKEIKEEKLHESSKEENIKTEQESHESNHKNHHKEVHHKAEHNHKEEGKETHKHKEEEKETHPHKEHHDKESKKDKQEKKEESKKESHKSNRKKKKKSSWQIILLSIIAVLLLIYIIYLASTSGVEAAVIVNGEIISIAELDEQYASIPESSKSVFTKEMVLDQMITEKLLFMEAEKNGFVLTDEEVDEKLALIVAEFPEGVTLENLMELNNITEPELKSQLKRQLSVLELINYTVASEVEITEEEAKAFFDENLVGEDFESVKADIITALEAKEQQEMVTTFIMGLKTNADIKILIDLDYSECMEMRGISADGIVFYCKEDSQVCSAVRNDLDSLAIDYFEINTEDADMVNRLNSCLIKDVDNKVPQFICPKNGQVKLGTLSQNKLTEFANACV